MKAGRVGTAHLFKTTLPNSINPQKTVIARSVVRDEAILTKMVGRAHPTNTKTIFLSRPHSGARPCSLKLAVQFLMSCKNCRFAQPTCEYPSQPVLSASTIFILEAFTAGNRPPTSPMTSATTSDSAAILTVRVKLKASSAKVWKFIVEMVRN